MLLDPREPSRMLLALDVGNTNVVVGVYEGDRLRGHWRLQTAPGRTADEYGLLIRGLMEAGGLRAGDVDAVAIASVVPALKHTLAELARKGFGQEPGIVGVNLQPRLPVRYDPPSDVGADRLVDAVAAVRRYGTPAIVVDFGTATTFNAISREGEYLGGAIAPGVGTSLEGLLRTAARLYRFDLAEPEHVIGGNTVEAMQSGTFYGFISLLEGMVQRFKAEIGDDARVIATGGWSGVIGTASHVVDHIDPLLTLEGLRLVWEERSSQP
jgi:type III pantothenate kinase